MCFLVYNYFMIRIHDKDMSDLTALYHIALGLEQWFPANNSAFAYGSRLCEETGELVEALVQYDASSSSEQHLVKEIKDVLQIVMGVLGIYRQTKIIPADISAFLQPPQTISSKDAIIKLSICAGHFADAINHAESQGIKQQKHEKTADVRLVKAARSLIACIAHFIQQYDLHELLEKEIEKDYKHFTAKGLIRVDP